MLGKQKQSKGSDYCRWESSSSLIKAQLARGDAVRVTALGWEHISGTVTGIDKRYVWIRSRTQTVMKLVHAHVERVGDYGATTDTELGDTELGESDSDCD